MKILTVIRMIAVTLVLGILSWRYIRLRISRKKQPESEEEAVKNFEQDEDGFFPWEIDINDSPERIPDNAQRYRHDSGRSRTRRW